MPETPHPDRLGSYDRPGSNPGDGVRGNPGDALGEEDLQKLLHPGDRAQPPDLPSPTVEPLESQDFPPDPAPHGTLGRPLTLGLYGLLALGLAWGGCKFWTGHWDPRCDAAYGGVCLPSPPPRLTCDRIPVQNFRVYTPMHPDRPPGLGRFDPHGLDPDGDGYGCEKGGPLAFPPLPGESRG
jgi:hypothetical protein